MLPHLLYFDSIVLEAYLNICCQLNTPVALKSHSAFKKHNELVKWIKQNDVNNAANVKNKTLPFVYGAAFAVIFYNPVVLCDHGSLKIGFNTIKNIFRLRKACTHFLSGVSYWHGIFHMSISCRGKKKN